MYDFSKDLIKGEKIIYTGKSISGSGSNNLFFESIGLIIFIAMFIVLNFIISDKGFVYTFLSNLIINIILLFSIISLSYLVIHNGIIKNKRTKNDQFCITNIRVIKYDDELHDTTYGYLDKFNTIHTVYVKDNHGDIKITYEQTESYDIKKEQIETAYAYESTNPEKIILVLEQVENLNEVVEILNKQMKEASKKVG